jgi:hypothetical protein
MSRSDSEVAVIERPDFVLVVAIGFLDTAGPVAGVLVTSQEEGN